MNLVANARMYAVSPECEAAWQDLLRRVFADAGVPWLYFPYPAPQPLEELWRRPDLGAVFMCGYPVALGIAPVQPIAAPVPALDWARGRAVYRSDFIVRADSAFRALADTFGHRLGWTVEHSHSGFNAPRHHLLAHRGASGKPLYRESIGPLVTARRILDSVVAGTIDVGPLDAYWHALLALHRPDLTAGIRVVDSTDVAPMPPLVAAGAVAPEQVERLRAAFVGAPRRPWFAALAPRLLIAGFQPMTVADYAPTLQWQRNAQDAGYPAPA